MAHDPPTGVAECAQAYDDADTAVADTLSSGGGAGPYQRPAADPLTRQPP